MNKTLVLGLDGATFDVLDPLIEDGHLPNLAALISDGARVPLDSTMPPVTGPAWLALATGRSPGQTGIYDFLHRDPTSDGFDFKYAEGRIYQGQSVWDYLSESGVHCGVVDYPMLDPAYEINGFVVAGGLGTTDHTVTPESLEEDLASLPKPREHLNLRDEKYEQDLQVFYEDVVENVERRVQIISRLLENQEWEFCWAVLQEIDWVQHLMWKCFDDSHPAAESVTEDERQLFVDFWKRIDEAVGEFLALLPGDANVIIQSDHGFGPMYDQAFRLNTWLKQEGYLVPKSFSGTHWTVKKGLRRTLGKAARAVHLREWAPSLFRWGKDKTANMAIQVNSVDLSETLLFEPGHIGSMGGLYINHQALGNQSVDALLDEVSQKLESFSKTNDLGLELYRPEELYGHKAEGSPDLIVRMEGGMIEDGGWDEPIIDTLPDRLSQQNGTHNRTGILVASGPDFVEGSFDRANCWDFAPTLLHAYGLPVPESMDGTVLTDILVANRPIEVSESERSDATVLARDEQEAVEQQLSDLGYFE